MNNLKLPDEPKVSEGLEFKDHRVVVLERLPDFIKYAVNDAGEIDFSGEGRKINNEILLINKFEYDMTHDIEHLMIQGPIIIGLGDHKYADVLRVAAGCLKAIQDGSLDCTANLEFIVNSDGAYMRLELTRQGPGLILTPQCALLHSEVKDFGFRRMTYYDLYSNSSLTGSDQKSISLSKSIMEYKIDCRVAKYAPLNFTGSMKILNDDVFLADAVTLDNLNLMLMQVGNGRPLLPNECLGIEGEVPVVVNSSSVSFLGMNRKTMEIKFSGGRSLKPARLHDYLEAI